MPAPKHLTPLTVYLKPGEIQAVKAACAEAGVSIADAVRHGTILFAQARSAKLTKRGRPPKKKEQAAAPPSSR